MSGTLVKTSLKLHFYNMDDTRIDCARCHATKKDGEQCTRRTCKYEKYCFQHNKSIRGTEIKKSSIPSAGDGLYVTRDFKKGERIASYDGDVVTYSEYASRPVGSYGLGLSNNQVIDASSTQSSMGRWVNSPRRTKKRSNSIFEEVPGSNKGYIRATRNLRAGTEVLVGYGSGYWIDR